MFSEASIVSLELLCASNTGGSNSDVATRGFADYEWFIILELKLHCGSFLFI